MILGKVQELASLNFYIQHMYNVSDTYSLHGVFLYSTLNVKNKVTIDT
jgi:hypothetical protein